MEFDPPNYCAGYWSAADFTDVTTNHLAGYWIRSDNNYIPANRQHMGPRGHRTEFFPFAESSNEQRYHLGRWPRVPLSYRNKRHSRRASLGSWTNGGSLKTARAVDYGVLANHIWSFAETSSLGPDVNSTFIQPFIGYTTSAAFTTTINTESTYNWLSHRWIIPINLLFSQVVTIAGQPISLQAGPRYYATTTDQGARWGVRFNVTLLFPAK
jgi:hypothetical protein